MTAADPPTASVCPLDPLFETGGALSQAARRDLLLAEGDRLLGKGDARMAFRLFVHAAIADPSSVEAAEGMAAAGARLVALRRRLDPRSKRRRLHAAWQATTGRGTGGRPAFDYLFVTSGRSASTALQQFTSMHPDAFTVPKQELDRALEDGSEAILASAYAAQFGPRSNSRGNALKVGLMQHQYVAGLYGGPEYAARVAAIADRRRFIQSVREPVELFRSLFNNQIVVTHADSHDLHRLVPDGWFGGTRIFDLDAFAAGGSRPREPDRTTAAVPAGFPPTREQREALLDGMIGTTVKLNTIGRLYSAEFDEWTALDFPLESRSRPGGGMERAFDPIGVAPDYRSAVFDIPVNDANQQLTVRNFIPCQWRGRRLPIGLGVSGSVMLSYTFDLLELAAFDAPPEWREAGLGPRRICVTADEAAWLACPADDRRALIESGCLETLARDVLVPEFLRARALWFETLRPHFVSSDDPELCRRVYGANREEIEGFLTAQPAFAEKWPRAREYL